MSFYKEQFQHNLLFFIAPKPHNTAKPTVFLAITLPKRTCVTKVTVNPN